MVYSKSIKRVCKVFTIAQKIAASDFWSRDVSSWYFPSSSMLRNNGNGRHVTRETLTCLCAGTRCKCRGWHVRTSTLSTRARWATPTSPPPSPTPSTSIWTVSREWMLFEHCCYYYNHYCSYIFHLIYFICVGYTLTTVETNIKQVFIKLVIKWECIKQQIAHNDVFHYLLQHYLRFYSSCSHKFAFVSTKIFVVGYNFMTGVSSLVCVVLPLPQPMPDEMYEMDCALGWRLCAVCWCWCWWRCSRRDDDNIVCHIAPGCTQGMGSTTKYKRLLL